MHLKKTEKAIKNMDQDTFENNIASPGCEFTINYNLVKTSKKRKWKKR